MVNNVKDYVRSISKPNFVSQKILSKNFVAIHEIKPVLTLNKAIYAEFSILDLSKYFMDEFHYKHIESKYDAKLLFTDTDSLLYEIKTEDVYEDFYGDKNLFDLSGYPSNSKFFDAVNKKVIRHNMKRIQSKLHRTETCDVCEISLSCFDDKRYILDDDVNSLAYFHKDIKD